MVNRAVVLVLLTSTSRAKLTPNAQGSPQELKGSTAVCAGRSDHCSVLLDVPSACGGTSSACPVAFFYHGHGGNNKGFAHNGAGTLCHEYGFIGIYPQGELYDGGSGWNDGSMKGNACAWDDFSCQKDPNDGNFTVGIIDTVANLGGRGNVYMWGGSNGANSVQIFAANANAAMRIAGISAGWGQLMAKPPRSGPAPFDWNQPASAAAQKAAGRPGDGRSVAQQAQHGDADSTIPYQGGPRFGSDVWILMSEPDSDAAWALHNGCTGGLTNTSVPATYHDKASGKQVATVAIYHQYHGCPPAAPVEFYQVIGAPHGGASSINGKDPFYIVFDFWSKVENNTVPTPAPPPSPPTPPTPAPPTPPPTPAPPTPSPTPGGRVPADCIKALQAACPDLQGKGEPCDECVKAHQHTPSVLRPCKVNPFQVTEAAFCGSR